LPIENVTNWMRKLKEAKLMRTHLNFSKRRLVISISRYKTGAGTRGSSIARTPRNSFIGSSGTIDLPGIARRKGSCRTCGIVFPPNHVRECIFSPSRHSWRTTQPGVPGRKYIFFLSHMLLVSRRKRTTGRRTGARISWNRRNMREWNFALNSHMSQTIPN